MSVLFHISSLLVPPRVDLNARMQKGLRVKAGATVILEAEVFGKPMPRVTWKRGDDSLKSREGQVITHQRHHFQLEMTAVTKEHTGVYTILAENASGSKSAEIELNILGEYLDIFLRDHKRILDLTFYKYTFSNSLIILSLCRCAQFSC